MKRYRFLKFYIDSTRSIFNGLPTPIAEKMKEEQKAYLGAKYGDLGFDAKFKRWISVPKPVLSVVDEHTQLLNDIEDAYILGSFYSSLTGACCLGERIFNQIILRIKEEYQSHSRYKEIYRKDSINDWDLGISILKEWDIISIETEKRYRALYKLRTNSVHFQNKPQDLPAMTQEAIVLINQIVSDLFGLDHTKKDLLIWCEVPGEIYLRKKFENSPFVKAFYIPSVILAGYKHTIVGAPGGRMIIEDKHTYLNTEVSDEEFVKMRNEYSGKS